MKLRFLKILGLMVIGLVVASLLSLWGLRYSKIEPPPEPGAIVEMVPETLPVNDFCRLHPAFCSPCTGAGCVEKINSSTKDCFNLGASDACLNRDLFSHLEQAEFAFNALSEMQVAEPQTIAFVIDTTGKTDFSVELENLPGVQAKGNTRISLIMEAQIVGPAFKIDPAGRQRQELSRLNPTRWDWEVTPKRSGQHQLEVSLYVIATKGGKSIGEEKALAQRKIINVAVSPLNRLTKLASDLDPILTILVTTGTVITAVLAWFGFKSWRDVSGRKTDDAKPQKIEVTIKEASAESISSKNNAD